MKSQKDRTGFTLIELLVVITVIGMLAAILIPAAKKTLLTGKKTRAVTEMQAVVAAVKAYRNEYGKMPDQNGTAGDYSYGTVAGADADNEELIVILRALDIAPNGSHALNLRKIPFLEVKDYSLDGQNFVDPWGNQYEITIDTDYNDICENLTDGYPDIENRTVVVWSRGPDGDLAGENDEDDIRSW